MRRLLPLFLLLTPACVGELFSGPPKGPDEVPPGLRLPDGGVKPPTEVVVAPAQIRVLSAPEYRNTVRDLLGLTTSPTLTHADWTGGYDNGAALKVDENLFSALLVEAESLSQQYVATRLGSDFSCFDAANIADDCVRSIISTLGRRAYRKPLSQEQRDELLAFFQTVTNDGGGKLVAVESIVARLLVSPHLLYRTEVGQPVQPGQLGTVRFKLDDFEKASLIAYTLTGTMPDEALLSAAEAGELSDETKLRSQIKRLWQSPRTRERQADFFRQWLRVTALDRMARQPADFSKLPSAEVGTSLKAEFDAYIGAVIFDGTGTLPALFTETFSFVDRNTAPLYGLTSTSDVPTRVSLDPATRRGVLTLASTMAAIGSATDGDRDRPVLRGLMVKNQILCEEVGPPSSVNTVAAAQTASSTPNFADLTTREQYEAMMQQGAECNGCHRQFMPIGFAFGKYDALGRYRVTQHGRTVNSAVSDLPYANDVHSFSGAQELVTSLAGNPTTTSCWSKNFIKYALGNSASPHTETLSDSLTEKLGTDPVTVAKLIEETLASPHLYVRVAELTAQLPPAGGGTGGGGGGGSGDGGGGGGGGGSAVTTTVLLASRNSLAPDASRRSTDGRFNLIYQLDGNLVLYGPSGPLWASNTGGRSLGTTAMQGDGNLVVYDRDNVPVFNTGTHGNPGAQLHIDSTGTLFIIATDGRTLWSSGVP